MNIGLLKSLSYLTSVGLLGGIGYIGYDYYENDRDASYFDVERAGKILNSVQPPEPPKSVALDYKADITPAIVTFDWTGKPEAEVVVPTGPTEDELAEIVTPVTDILEVLMVLSYDENPGDSLCLVRFVDQTVSPRERWYAAGSTLPAPNDDVSVYRIRPEGVEFSFAKPGREHELVVPSAREDGSLIVSVDDASKLIARASAELVRPTAGDASTAPAKTEKRNGQFYIGTEDAQMWGDNYSDILSRDVKTATYFKDGKRAGVELTDVRPGSIAARHGAQSGDVIISINGTPVSSQQEAIAFAKNNSERYSVWQVQVLRFGRIETVVYHSPNQ